MGELISGERFTAYYVSRNGHYPQSHYHQKTLIVDDRPPTSGEMGFFLERGDIWMEPPWKTVKYYVPDHMQEEAFNDVLSLGPDFQSSSSLQFNGKGRVVGSRIEVVGPYADTRGRPTIEALISTDGRLTQVNYVRRRVRHPRERGTMDNFSKIRRTALQRQERQ